MRLIWLAALAAAMMSAHPALAHHSTAAVYDRTKLTAIQGFVTRIEIQNPHSMLEISIPLGDGQSAIWQVESRGVEVMNRIGFDRGVVQVGDRVTVTGSPAWAYEHRLWLSTLRTSRGKTYEFETPN